MFTPDTIIDTVQNGKKTFVKTFVQNEVMTDAMNDFVDQQTNYTKKAMSATQDMMTTVAQETVKAFQNISKFDYAKFGEGVMKAYTAQNTAKAK
jgi:uncharacterized protein YxeA